MTGTAAPGTNGAAKPLRNGQAPRGLGEADPYRAPPHNLEAEQALLGAILVNNATLDRVSGLLRPESFFDPLHQQIFETAAKLIAAGRRADPITLKTFFENAEPIDATLTVSQYLGRLAANASTIINARDYARTIKDDSSRRQLIVISEDMRDAAFEGKRDPGEIMEESEARTYSLREHGSHERDAISFGLAIDRAIGDVDAANKRGGGLAGLSSGINAADALLGGLPPSTLNILAGRPGMGKTSLALNIATNLATAGTPVLFISLEMSASELALRQLSRSIGVPAVDMQRGRLPDPEATMRDMLQAKQRMQTWPLFIDESGGLTPAQIAARARRMRRTRNVELIVIDHVGLINGSVYRSQNRTQELTEITKGLKSLAKELGVPILALSQLSRDVEKRTDNRRPHLSDLRDSGSIEQDADAVMFVYRDSYYLEREKPDPANADAYATWQRKLAAAHGKAELIVAKLRNGPTGIAELAFDDKTMTFATLADGGRP